MIDPTESLIDRLTEDLEPVRTLPRLRSAFAIVLAVWAAFLSLALFSSGRGLAHFTPLGDWMYGASFAGLVIAALGGTASALAAGVPGRERIENGGMLVAFLGLIAAACLCLFEMGGSADYSAHLEADGMCFRDAVWASILPAGVILTFLIRGWATRPVVASLVALLSSGAVGSILVHLSCDFLSPKHVLVGHLSVPLVLSLLGLYPLGVLLRRLRG